ncbi:MAG TPA: protein-disulfide reductase DsbD domain-containing protein, partial [Burkholderiaceae bacterium]|nr:protein-disulfide reductase DsbD domain-containing protein [Burkholderiaceae bacterium]
MDRIVSRLGVPARLAAAALAVALGLPALVPDAAHAQPAPAAARTGAQRVDAVEVELVAERAAIGADGVVELGLRIAHDPHWHTYWRNPGDSGLATQVAPAGPAGARFDALRWPAPQRMFVGPLANYGYEGEIVLPWRATVPASAVGSTVRFEAHAQWLVCKDVCIPGEARVALELPVAAAGASPARARHAALFDAAAKRIPDADAALSARLHRDGRGVALAFATPAGRDAIARAEFFPYPEGVVSAPAPQPLARTADGWRLDLALADGAT